MGVPDDQDDSVRFEIDDLNVYVTRELLESLGPGVQQMPFYIDGYGRFYLVFAEPWGG